MRKSIYSLRGLAILAMMSLMFLTSACTKIDVSSGPEEVPEGMLKDPAPDLSKRPDGLANEFLKCIKDGEFSKAYDYLNPEAQGTVSREKFVSSLQKYMATPSSKRAYMTRKVTSERIVGKTGTIKVTDSSSPNSKAWIWEFEEDYAGWRIRSLDLPPVMRYKERFSY